MPNTYAIEFNSISRARNGQRRSEVEIPQRTIPYGSLLVHGNSSWGRLTRWWYTLFSVYAVFESNHSDFEWVKLFSLRFHIYIFWTGANLLNPILVLTFMLWRCAWRFLLVFVYFRIKHFVTAQNNSVNIEYFDEILEISFDYINLAKSDIHLKLPFCKINVKCFGLRKNPAIIQSWLLFCALMKCVLRIALTGQGRIWQRKRTKQLRSSNFSKQTAPLLCVQFSERVRVFFSDYILRMLDFSKV